MTAIELRQAIQEQINLLSPFQKLSLVFNLLTFPSIKEIISDKLTKQQIDEVLIKERMAGSVAREFFMKQIKIRIDKNAHYTLELFFTLISIPTFTYSLDN